MPLSWQGYTALVCNTAGVVGTKTQVYILHQILERSGTREIRCMWSYEKCIRNFGRKTSQEETIWGIVAYDVVDFYLVHDRDSWWIFVTTVKIEE